jgi:hypothetical protein
MGRFVRAEGQQQRGGAPVEPLLFRTCPRLSHSCLPPRSRLRPHNRQWVCPEARSAHLVRLRGGKPAPGLSSLPRPRRLAAGQPLLRGRQVGGLLLPRPARPFAPAAGVQAGGRLPGLARPPGVQGGGAAPRLARGRSSASPRERGGWGGRPTRLPSRQGAGRRAVAVAERQAESPAATAKPDAGPKPTKDKPDGDG